MRHLLFSLICLICHPGLHAQTDSTQTAAFNALMTNASRQLRAASYDSCFISLSEAMRLADSGRKFGLMAKARSEMGVLHIYQGRYAMALANVQGALSIYERMGLTEGIAECHNNMGSIYYAQKEFEKARASYGKCLVIREQGKDRRALGIIYNNMGDVSLKLKDPSTALEYHRRSLAIWEELGSVSGKAITLELMGDCMDRMGDAEGALAMIKKGFATLKDSDNDARTRIIMGIKIGNLLNALGKAGEARSWCENAYSLALALNSKQEVQNSCLCLFETYKALNMPARALIHYQEYIAMKDTIFGQEMTKEVTRLEMSYAFDKKQLADSLRFVAETELQHERIIRQRIGLISTGGILILVMALGFAIYNGKKSSDLLLLNILPKATALELKKKGMAETRQFDAVTVLFTDFKGFTEISQLMPAAALVKELHEYFSEFDRICERHGMEKIKTIGDSYMAAGGLPTPNSTHATDAVKAAMEMAKAVADGKARKQEAGLPYFEVRIGIHTGPVVAGIVGIKKFQYDIWGDTVNTASRMESSGEVGRVNISEATYALVKDQFACEYRGEIAAKGKGKVSMYFVQ